jgi:hypothetical protein
MPPVTAIILLGPVGTGDLTQAVAQAQLACATDAVMALAGLPNLERIIVAHAPGWIFDFPVPTTIPVIFDPDSADRAFHFGERLVALIERYRLERVFYLGAGSLPLLPVSEMAAVIDQIAQVTEPTLVTNNLRSADWVAFNQAAKLGTIVSWLKRDNMLAWRLHEDLHYVEVTLPPSAATRLDIDTPFDLQVLALHPRTPHHLRAYLAQLEPRLNLVRLRAALPVLRTWGRRITLLGRVSPAMVELLGARKLWTRVFSEERSMVATQRQAHEIFSFMADHIERIGPVGFAAQLAQTSDLVLFDTRVYMAHHQIWPSDEERFASDMGQIEKIGDARLRHLTDVMTQAPIPILLGGHNVVAGGLYALTEIADLSAADYQP